MRSHRAGHYQPIEETLAMLALGGGGAPGAGIGYAFVFRPGGAADKNVFTTWPTLMAAVSAVQGPKIVELDASIAPTVVSAGAWDVNDITFVSSQPAVGTVLTIPTGATFTIGVPGGGFQVDYGAELTSTSAAPVIVVGSDINVAMQNFGVIQSNPGAAAFFHVLATGALNMELLESCILGDSTTAAVLLDAGATFIIDAGLGSSTISAHAVDGVGVSWSALLDSSTPVRTPTGTATPVIHFLDNAVQMTYTAAIVANWSGTNPTSVANALDRLAAHVGPVP